MDFDLTRTIALLERTPPTLRDWLSGLSNEWVASSSDRGDWGPFDIVGHLNAGRTLIEAKSERLDLA